MIWNRLVVAAVIVLVLAVAVDSLRGDDPRDSPQGDYRIDLSSARDGTWLHGPPSSCGTAIGS